MAFLVWPREGRGYSPGFAGGAEVLPAAASLLLRALGLPGRASDCAGNGLKELFSGKRLP